MAATPREYAPLLDPLRILASLAVVRHHMRPGFLFGVGFGLPLFLVIMFALAASTTKREPFLHFARRKSAYLLVPWLRWSALYLALLIVSDLARGLPAFGRLETAMIWYGGSPMLWFLPFAAVALIALRPLRWASQRVPPATAVICLALLAAVATNAVAYGLTLPMPRMPNRVWLRFTPALFWGLAVGQTWRVEAEWERCRLLIVVVLFALLSFWLSPLRDQAEDLPRRFAVAVSLACLGFGWRPRVPHSVLLTASVTFGVYLVHGLVAKVLVTVFDVFAWPLALHVTVVWVLSALLVLLLRRASVPWQECAAPPELASPVSSPSLPSREQVLSDPRG